MTNPEFHARLADMKARQAKTERRAQIALVALILLLTAALLLLLPSCAVSQVTAQSPAVITGKAYIYTDRNRNAEYQFVDASGRLFMFYDGSGLHEVGDTINLPY